MLPALLAVLLALLPGCAGCQKSIDCALAEGGEERSRAGCASEPSAEDVERGKQYSACQAFGQESTLVEADLGCSGSCAPSTLANGQVFAWCGAGWTCKRDRCARDAMTVDRKPVECWTCPSTTKP